MMASCMPAKGEGYIKCRSCIIVKRDPMSSTLQVVNAGNLTRLRLTATSCEADDLEFEFEVYRGLANLKDLHWELGGDISEIEGCTAYFSSSLTKLTLEGSDYQVEGKVLEALCQLSNLVELNLERVSIDGSSILQDFCGLSR